MGTSAFAEERSQDGCATFELGTATRRPSQLRSRRSKWRARKTPEGRKRCGWALPQPRSAGGGSSFQNPKRIMACLKNLIMVENGSFQVRAEGSTRGRVELRPRAGRGLQAF